MTAIQSGRPSEALSYLSKACETDPDYWRAHLLHGLALFNMHRYEPALRAYERAYSLTAKPGERAICLSDQSAALLELLRLDEAEKYARQALALDCNLAQARENLAAAQMVQGRWSNWSQAVRHTAKNFGWERQLRTQLRPINRDLVHWDGGGEVAGKTVLVWSSEGLGDAIQYSRYLPKLEALGASVIFAAPPSLVGFISGAIDMTGPIPPFDVYCFLTALPGFFNTTSADIPTGAIFAPEDEVSEWASQLGPNQGRRRIGIKWSGNPGHIRTKQRDIPLPALLSAMPQDAELFSLHPEPTHEEEYRLALRGVRNDICHVGKASLATTAGLIANLDRVVTVDTSVAHLAGALECPTSMLVSYMPDPRWLLNRDDTPWYPSMRLFRQTSPNDWTGALESLRLSLAIGTA